MPHWALLLLWCHWVFQALGALWQGRKFLGYLRREPRQWNRPYDPKVHVIVPFKGLDADLPACVAALCTQDFNNYQLHLVLESPDDPAYPILQREIAHFQAVPHQFYFAGVAAANQGQKVHNQLYVLERVLPAASDDDILLFADSDAVPGPQWLRRMIHPLPVPKFVGASTGYRWLVPQVEKGSAFWSALGSIINSSAACCYWRKGLTQVWGGSMAVRAGAARQGDLIARWQGALTDDYPLTRMCRALGVAVVFVPQALVPSPVDMDLPSLWNFGLRQYTITRVYMPWLFLTALTISTLWVAGLVSAWGYLLASALGYTPAGSWIWAAGAIALVFLANQGRVAMRGRIIAQCMPEKEQAALQSTLAIERWTTALWMTLHWLIIVRSAVGQTFAWRGIRYRLRGPNDVQRLG